MSEAIEKERLTAARARLAAARADEKKKVEEDAKSSAEAWVLDYAEPRQLRGIADHESDIMDGPEEAHALLEWVLDDQDREWLEDLYDDPNGKLLMSDPLWSDAFARRVLELVPEVLD